MSLLNGGELIIECLKRHGIRQFFGISGGQMGTILDAIGHHRELSLFVPRNETVVPIMASGYTAVSGLPAVSMATVGAGVVYEVAGLVKAWLDYLPILSIAPQVQSYKTKPHQENLQACHQDELFYPITKWNAIVYHWERIPQLIDRGLREALSGIPGPVHLDIPVDILFKRKKLSLKKRKRVLPPGERTRYSGPIKGEEEQLESAASALLQAERPLVIVGQGFGRPHRYPEIKRYLNRLGTPVITTFASSGVLNGGDLCFVANTAAFNSRSPEIDRIKESDLVILIGVDRYARDLIAWLQESGPKRRLIQIETDPMAFIQNKSAIFPVYADPITALSRLEKTVMAENNHFTTWRNLLTETVATAASDSLGNSAHARLFSTLSERLSDKDIVVVDSGSCCSAVTAVLQGASCRHLFIMDETDVAGAGLPFAVGALLADRDRRVTLICDKKALFRHLRELQPLVSHQLGLRIICVDEPDDETNVADLGRVLRGFGCRTWAQKTDRDGFAPFMEGEAKRPYVFVI